MHELITPEQSDQLVLGAALLLTVGLAAWGWLAARQRGLLAALLGPLVWAAWQAHKYVTRFDTHSGYFGLDKVSVLLVEIVTFALVGAGLGWFWRKITAETTVHNAGQGAE